MAAGTQQTVKLTYRAFVEPAKDDRYGYHGIDIADGYVVELATDSVHQDGIQVWDPTPGGGQSQKRRNLARLIEASPKLLEAADNFVTRHDQQFGAECPCSSCEPFRAAIAAAREPA